MVNNANFTIGLSNNLKKFLLQSLPFFIYKTVNNMSKVFQWMQLKEWSVKLKSRIKEKLAFPQAVLLKNPKLFCHKMHKATVCMCENVNMNSTSTTAITDRHALLLNKLPMETKEGRHAHVTWALIVAQKGTARRRHVMANHGPPN